MLDSCGRTIDYLRISVTDRCNLRCVYCMPEHGVEMVSHHQVLSYEELIHLAGIFATLGVKKIKLTGGEPLVRRNLEELIRGLKGVQGIEQVTLTTNGILLEEQGTELIEAGLDGVNISLDTLDREHYREITRGGDVDAVLKGMHKMLVLGGIPVKVNAVPNNISNEEIRDLAGLAKDYPVAVRFIELMPIGMGKEKLEDIYNQEQRVAQVLEDAYGKLEDYNKPLGNGPSKYVSIEGFQGKIGFISAMSHKFCHQCNRVRLTSEGVLKTCLQYDSGYDLLSLIRSEGTDEELTQIIIEAIQGKHLEHHFLDMKEKVDEKRLMSQIGG